APTAQALTAWSEAKDEWQTDKSSIRPFQLFFDLEDLAAARRRLEAKDYLVEVFPVQRLLPWLNLQTPLRLDWQKRPLAFSAEILAYNALLETADTSDQEAFVEKTVGDFLVARYGANSLELEAFLSRRADERTLQALIGQLAQALNSAIDTTARNSYLALWLAEYRQNYANRFQTNLYQNIDEKWLSPGRILLISEGWFPD
ncbi:MAG: hypothetical protein KKI09_04210, partial [Spirochaetes bacterium]|nr:hypothetical protein [Spirochaetota bacterium]